MQDSHSAAVAAVKKLCAGLIQELAELGGEQMLFSHMNRSLDEAADRGDLASLQATWKDLRVWTRGLSTAQQAHVSRRMHVRFGIDFSEDEAWEQGAQPPDSDSRGAGRETT